MATIFFSREPDDDLPRPAVRQRQKAAMNSHGNALEHLTTRQIHDDPLDATSS